MLLFEALEVRNEYRRKRTVLEDLLEGEDSGIGSLGYRNSSPDKYRETEEFAEERERLSEELRSLRKKEVKLNQEIQKANLETELTVNDETMTLSEALERRKALNSKLGDLVSQLDNSKTEGVIYKEDRDIVISPDRPFNQLWEEYEKSVVKFRTLQTKIHKLNHTVEINWNYEE